MNTERELTRIGADKLPEIPMPTDPWQVADDLVRDDRKRWEFEQANERG